MTDLWTYTDDALVEDTELVGFDVEATDGHIGKIDEASTTAGDSYIVVDTGFWIFGKRRLIPARSIRQVNVADRKVFLSLTKDQVKDGPDYDDMTRTDEQYRTTVSDYYGRWPY